MHNHLLWIAVALPLAGAVFAYGLGRRQAKVALWSMLCASVVTLGVLSVILWQVLHGQESVFTSDGLCASGVALAADGFRALYAWLSALLFAAASVFSFQYFEGKRNVPRFAAFTLLTLSAVIGLFLSDQLLTTVMFFEVMSLASYPWIAHEETPGAMRAAQSYLWIAIIGGLCMLMGMLLLPSELLQLRYSRGLPEAAPTSGLMLPAILMLVGFGAKAGAFPLHVWLPKAYPASPAPATALLSAVLSKAGVFGILLLSAHVMREIAAWHALMFWVGILTMVLGRDYGAADDEYQARAGLVQHEPDRVYPGRRWAVWIAFPSRGYRRAGAGRAYGQPFGVQDDIVSVRGRRRDANGQAAPERTCAALAGASRCCTPCS